MNTSVKFDVKTQRSKKLCYKTKTSNKKKFQEKDLIARIKKKKNSWKQKKKAEGWAYASVMKEGNNTPLYRKLLR